MPVFRDIAEFLEKKKTGGKTQMSAELIHNYDL